jgi:beta-phosphoglucomutase family hydrolase
MTAESLPPPALSPPAGVVFDMDGVLVDSAGAHFESWRALGAENGLTITQAQFAATFGRHNGDIVPILFGAVSQQRLTALADRKEALYRDIVRGRVPAVPGAADLVRELRAAGLRLAVGSSGPLANIRLILRELGVSELFDAISSGEDVTRGKPDPQVFQIACERLGLPPQRCIVIEDAPVGIAAAKAAGCRAVAVMLHHGRDKFTEADVVVERLSDLILEKAWRTAS